jgi:hypothetical protein
MIEGEVVIGGAWVRRHAGAGFGPHIGDRVHGALGLFVGALAGESR